MKIGEHELPDSCPEGCQFSEDIANYGQNAVCIRCPVFCCAGEKLVEPGGYREDWAKEWAEFFDGGKFPDLKLVG
jgi:hypothetical protein